MIRSGNSVRCVDSPSIRAWGYGGSDAANIPADTDLYALSNQHRNALHQMRRADEAEHDRATRSKLRCADLPVHALRFRRELLEGALDRTTTRSARTFLPASTQV